MHLSFRWQIFTVALILSAMALISLAPVVSHYKLPTPDAMAYADCARSFARGEGVMSGRLNPDHVMAVSYSKRLPASLSKIPYLHNAGWPLALAPAFAIFGPGDLNVLLNALFWWVLTGILVFCATRTIASDYAGWLAVSIYSLHPRTIGYALNGLSEPFSQTMLLAALLLLLPREKEKWQPAASGTLLGLAGGIRQVFPLLGLSMIFSASASTKPRRIKVLIVALIGFIAITFAWRSANPLLFPAPARSAYQWVAIDHNAKPPTDYPWWFKAAQKVTGNGLLAFTELYPGHQLEGQITAPSPPFSQAFLAVKQKMGINLEKIFWILLTGLGGPALTVLFWFSVFLPIKQKNQQIWKSATITLLVMTCLMCLPLFVMERYFDLLLPLIIVVTSAGVAAVLVKIQTWKRYAATAAATLFILTSTWPTQWMGIVSEAKADQLINEAHVDRRLPFNELARLIAHTDREDIILTDAPWACAWIGDRVCVLAPTDPAQIEPLRQRMRIKWVLLTFTDPIGRENWRQWAANLESAEDADWRFELGTRLAGIPLLLFAETMPPLSLAGNGELADIQ